MRVGTIAAVVGALALASCTDSETSSPTTASERTTSSTTSPTSSTSTSVAAAAGDCTQRPAGSAPSTFDPAEGTYSVQGFAIGGDPPSVTFDVVQWLSGDDARAAWLADHPDEPDGPPNDYYIVNVSERTRTASVAPDTTILLTHLRSDSTASVEPDDLAGLVEQVLTGNVEDTYWLTFDEGAVTEICEQYRP